MAGGVPELGREPPPDGPQELFSLLRLTNGPTADHDDLGVEREHEIDETDGDEVAETFDHG